MGNSPPHKLRISSFIIIIYESVEKIHKIISLEVHVPVGHTVSPKRRQRNHVIPPSESAKISQAFFRKLPGVSDSSEDLLPLRKAVAAAEPVLHGSFLVSVLHAVPVLCNHNGSNYIRQHRRKPVPVPLLLSSVQILLFRSVCFLTR